MPTDSAVRQEHAMQHPVECRQVPASVVAGASHAARCTRALPEGFSGRPGFWRLWWRASARLRPVGVGTTEHEGRVHGFQACSCMTAYSPRFDQRAEAWPVPHGRLIGASNWAPTERERQVDKRWKPRKNACSRLLPHGCSLKTRVRPSATRWCFSTYVGFAAKSLSDLV